MAEPDVREHGCCVRCREEWEVENVDLPTSRLLSRRMSICPECGSKRCQKADDHRSICWGDPSADPTWSYDPKTGDMRTDTTCGLCGQPAVGMASIGSTPYCHASDQGRSCYEQAQTILRRRGQTAGAVLLDDFIDSLNDLTRTPRLPQEITMSNPSEIVNEHARDLSQELGIHRVDPDQHQFLMNVLEAADTVEYHWTRYANASDNLAQADALIALSNAMHDLSSYLPGFNPETGEVDRDEI